MGNYCRRCSRNIYGKCSLGLHRSDDDIKVNGYSCFKGRILHIDEDGNYGDEMNEEEKQFMIEYCRKCKDLIL